MSGRQGQHFVAGVAESGSGEPFTAIDPIGGGAIGAEYREADPDQVDRAAEAAGDAKTDLQAAAPAVRAALLREIADGLIGLGDELVDCVSAETALPSARVQAERGRTIGQLEGFAALIEEGSWVEASIDHAIPDREPIPKPDLRRMNVGLGPVAVFGASNFPLAYSVAGGDTASALAAGCPVVVKAHPAHPGTSELVGRMITACVARAGLHPGTFSLVHGRTEATGGRLVQHAAIAAVGFTGSHRGGRALMDLAAARPEPVPVFAEMGSVNPVVILPRAMAARGVAIAEQLAASAQLGTGQFCTSPGMVLWCEGAGADAFVGALRDKLGGGAAGPTVHPTIRDAYERTIDEVKGLAIQVEATGDANAAVATAVSPLLLSTTGEAVQADLRLRSEIFGPAVLAVACASRQELLATIASLHGNLTGTVHGDGEDLAEYGDACAALREKVGRLIANGVPTGVEVCTAMVHGGPYPAAADARFSAVGATAIQRWARPVCWQDWPQQQLPPELQDDNPRGIRRTVDGEVG